MVNDENTGRNSGALSKREETGFDGTSLTPKGVLAQILSSEEDSAASQALANRLLSKFQTLANLLAAKDEELLAFDGMNPQAVKMLRLVAWVRDHGDDLAIGQENANQATTIGQTLAGAQLKPKPVSTPAVQSEMPLNVLGQTDLPLTEKPSRRERRNIQDVLIREGLMAVKLANEAKSEDDLEGLLVKRLGQNSIETRRRYAQSILNWFFPDGRQGLLPRAWQAYQDEAICNDLLRWSYLNQEPLMGGCVAEALFPCQNGLAIPPTYFDKYLQERLGEAPPEKTRERLKMNLKRTGFLERARSKPDRLLPVVSQKPSLLVLLHHLFASKAVRTVELRTLFANPFWKFLGYKSEDAVRDVLREADAAGLIGKYVVADQLEAVTTCFTLDQLLERKARL